jgi:hypothetical protein
LLAPAARGAQAVAQGLIVRVHAQAHDVHRDTSEGDGDLRTGDVGQAECARRGDGAVLTADLVVVGE